MNTTEKIAINFKEFINSQNGYDPYEVAVLCGQILKENNISNSTTTKHPIGVKLFDKENNDVYF